MVNGRFFYRTLHSDVESDEKSLARKRDARDVSDIENILDKIHPVKASPYCSGRDPGTCNTRHTLWEWAVFSMSVVVFGFVFLFLGGGITGVRRVDFKYAIPFEFFGWVAILTGLVSLLLWVIYFYGGIWRREALEEIEEEQSQSL